ncbi:nucleoside phosphorylase domain-containing protein [Penicillium canariense]|uniref:Nucleoside phosphorylase domain-containing protein n=1 Tax=Penicillium canariense TaxID=189055 RepID=A0A9W9HPK7_9EURO|nr:nucleoside phosphorylase domain-containing protein [Penicillium canariense]KAJ5152638.1 nucleoside phosphorylase domain-containing protein [Penicillium canariense]
MPPRTLSHEAYRVGWISPLEVEQIAAMLMLDEEHKPLPQMPADHNVYKLGSINNHNVVIAGLHQPGNCPAATVVAQMRMTFPNLRYGLLVGIGGGVPIKTDNGMIQLGHIVVSKPTSTHSGVIQYDHGRAREGHFERIGTLTPPPVALLNAAQSLSVQRAIVDRDPIWEDIKRTQTSRRRLSRFISPGITNDHLHQSDYIHQQAGVSCEDGGCDPGQRIERAMDNSEEPFIVVHRGTIASGELVVKDAKLRDRLGKQHGLLCFEMEAAGALANFPCLVIRGISDYCDSHKNDQWHGYAAAVAAAYARRLFFHLPIEVTQKLQRDSAASGEETVPHDGQYGQGGPGYNSRQTSRPVDSGPKTVIFGASDNSNPRSAQNYETNIAQTANLDDRTLVGLLHRAGFHARTLHEAVKNGLVEVLLKDGADVTSPDDDGWAPINLAAGSGHETVTRLLIEKGADLEAKTKLGNTPLLVAALMGHEAVVRLLLSKGADIEAKDKIGDTALLLAVHKGHEAVAKLLVESGANLEAQNKDGDTPLLLALHRGHEAVASLLVEQGANLEVKDNYSRTPLLLAAKNGLETMTRLLLEKDANVDTKDVFGDTSLLLAAENGHEAVVRLLVGTGANCDGCVEVTKAETRTAGRYRQSYPYHTRFA